MARGPYPGEQGGEGTCSWDIWGFPCFTRCQGGTNIGSDFRPYVTGTRVSSLCAIPVPDSHLPTGLTPARPLTCQLRHPLPQDTLLSSLLQRAHLPILSKLHCALLPRSLKITVNFLSFPLKHKLLGGRNPAQPPCF